MGRGFRFPLKTRMHKHDTNMRHAAHNHRCRTEFSKVESTTHRDVVPFGPPTSNPMNSHRSSCTIKEAPSDSRLVPSLLLHSSFALCAVSVEEEERERERRKNGEC